jgi:hypothetical protein
MNLDWSLAAGMLFDQLPGEAQMKVLQATEHLAADWEYAVRGGRLHRLASKVDNEYVLRVSPDLRVVVRHSSDLIMIVDIVPYKQIEGIRRAAQQHVAAPG